MRDKGVPCYVASPCKDCKDRYVKVVDGKTITCHGSCDKYEKFKEEVKHFHELERVEKFKYNVNMEAIATSMNRTRKRM